MHESLPACISLLGVSAKIEDVSEYAFAMELEVDFGSFFLHFLLCFFT